MKRIFSYLLAIVALITSVSAAVTIGYNALYGKTKVDPDTLCPIEESYFGTAILMDASDPISEHQFDQIKKYVRELFTNELKKHEWVGIYILRENVSMLPSNPIFFLCNPGSKNDADKLYENPTVYEKRQEKFFEQIDQVFDRFRENGRELGISPIIETIFSVSNSYEFKKTTRHRLIIISDMINNSKLLSHYSGDYDFDLWSSSHKDKTYIDQELLSNFHISILYLERPSQSQYQTPDLYSFWKAYFDHVDALKPIQELTLDYESQ